MRHLSLIHFNECPCFHLTLPVTKITPNKEHRGKQNGFARHYRKGDWLQLGLQ